MRPLAKAYYDKVDWTAIRKNKYKKFLIANSIVREKVLKDIIKIPQEKRTMYQRFLLANFSDSEVVLIRLKQFLGLDKENIEKTKIEATQVKAKVQEKIGAVGHNQIAINNSVKSWFNDNIINNSKPYILAIVGVIILYNGLKIANLFKKLFK